MKLKYEKTPSDRAREISDIRHNPIMRFLKNQDHFKFNVGDILIKQRRFSLNSEWETEVTPGVNTPKKYLYVFENELGIGYIKQLRVDGKGVTSGLVCTANFDPDYVKFQLDPDFVDHVLIGEDEFEYNREYANKKAFREDAIKKNTKILVRTGFYKKRAEWLSKLKAGDTFWAGKTLDEMVNNKFIVTTPASGSFPLSIEAANETQMYKTSLSEAWFAAMKVTDKQPFPMEDPLCGRPK